MNIQDFFRLGMKRGLPRLISKGGVSLELGPGNSPVGADLTLELPSWDADKSVVLPYGDEEIDTIHMYHFLEHINDPIGLLRECERVLCENGIINIVVPHQSQSLAYEDLDHKHFFNEHTIEKLLNNKGYEKNNGWLLRQHCSFIMAVELRNLSCFIQLVK